MQVRPPSIKKSNNDKRRKNQGADLCVRGPENKHAKQKRITTIKLQNSSLGQAYKDFGGVKNSYTRNTVQLCTSIKSILDFLFLMITVLIYYSAKVFVNPKIHISLLK